MSASSSSVTNKASGVYPVIIINDDEIDMTCPVCYKSLIEGAPRKANCCNKVFCNGCIEEIFKKSIKKEEVRCPLCRKESFKEQLADEKNSIDAVVGLLLQAPKDIQQKCFADLFINLKQLDLKTAALQDENAALKKTVGNLNDTVKSLEYTAQLLQQKDGDYTLPQNPSKQRRLDGESKKGICDEYIKSIDTAMGWKSDEFKDLDNNGTPKDMCYQTRSTDSVIIGYLKCGIFGDKESEGVIYRVGTLNPRDNATKLDMIQYALVNMKNREFKTVKIVTIDKEFISFLRPYKPTDVGFNFVIENDSSSSKYSIITVSLEGVEKR